MKVVIPETLNEITLDQFLKFQKVIKAEDITEDILCLAMVTIFCKLTVEQARNIEIKDYNEIVLQLSEVLKQEPKFIQRFSLEGMEFGFIPNLDSITAGEYIDLDTYLKDEETHINAMAILYRPIVSSIKNDYKIYAYESSDKYKDVMQFMPLDVYLGSMVFFYNLSNELLTATKLYFQQSNQAKELEAVLATSGVGISQFIQLLEEACSTLKKQLQWNYMSSLHS
jgi:hypothetical protein